ncbi:MAG: hypothetical protein J6O73_07865 [Lachnospiraceae bacterium]|nr:hypothetical protein [Lachnospiraceae bacterium]
MSTTRAKTSIKSPKTKPAKNTADAEKIPLKTAQKRSQTTKKRNTSAKKTATTAKKPRKSEAMTEEEKRDKAIKNEIKRLTVTLRDIPQEKRRAAKATIEDAAFLAVTMKDLREKIAREGTEIEYKNGENQYGTKQSPAVQTYLGMSAKLTAATKILLDCLPKTEVKEVDDKFDDFIVERGND